MPGDLAELVGERLIKRLVQLSKIGGLDDGIIRIVG